MNFSNPFRSEFPIFDTHPDLIYLDNGATTQKPKVVIDSQTKYYTKSNANVYRGNYQLALDSTDQYEKAREQVASFIEADTREIIFTKGATDGLNFLASSLGQNLREGDEILLTEMEHHANLVPWQMLTKQKSIVLKFIPVLENGELDLDSLSKLLTEKVKIVSLVRVSNVLGTINPVEKITKLAHEIGAIVVLDATQSVPHNVLEVKSLDIDFLVFSGHKLFAPMGTGVICGKYDLLEKLPVYQGGGDMIDIVSFSDFTLAPVPTRFEAGTPNVAGAVGLGVAVEWLTSLRKKVEQKAVAEFNFESLLDYENYLLNYATEKLLEIKGLSIFGTSKNKASVISFSVAGVNPLDLAIYLDNFQICVRAGKHCVQPLHTKFGLREGSLRVSLNFTNSTAEIDFVVEKIKSGIGILK